MAGILVKQIDKDVIFLWQSYVFSFHNSCTGTEVPGFHEGYLHSKPRHLHTETVREGFDAMFGYPIRRYTGVVDPSFDTGYVDHSSYLKEPTLF